MLRDYLRLQLLASDAGLMTTGVAVDIGGRSVLLYAKLDGLLSDGEGLQKALQWMGHASLKPCFRHWNVLKKNSNRAEHTEEYVEISCSDPHKFHRWTDAEFNEAMDVIVEAAAELERGNIPAVRKDECERAFGFRANADGLVTCPLLRPIVGWQTVTRYDWVHTFLADGLLTKAAWLLIDRCEHEGIASQEDVKSFLQADWEVAAQRRHHGRQLWRIFDTAAAKSNHEASTLKCCASELVTLYGLLRHWVMTSLPLDDERVSSHVRCFFQACAAVDVLILAKRGAIPQGESGPALRGAVAEFMESFTSVYGAQRVTPKFHWAFDVCDQLDSDKTVFDTFVIERLHLRVRNVAEHCKSLQSYEASVLSGVVNDHARRVQTGMTAHGLVGLTAPCPGLPGVVVSDHAEVGGKRVSVGDFVSRDARELARVVACAVDDGELYVIGDSWDVVDQMTTHSAMWRPVGTRCIWSASTTSECLAWRFLDTGDVIVVKL